MNRKKIILLLCFILGLTGCSFFNKNIMRNIEINNASCKIDTENDNHGGFNGDGAYFARIKCLDINYDELSSNWKKLPLSKSLDDFTQMDQCNLNDCKNFYELYNVPTIKNGYYYFIDRNSFSINKFDDSNLNNRSSWNFTFALLDKDTNIIYYYEFDS